MQDFLPPVPGPAEANALMDAAVKGDLAKMKEIVEAGAQYGYARDGLEAQAALIGAPLDAFRLLNLHPPGKLLNAAMYFAAFEGRAEVVDYFLEKDAFCQETLNASLFGACVSGSLPMVKKLLAAGADAGCGESCCLDAGIAGRHADITACLLAASKNYSAALAAYIEHEDTDSVIDMLAAGAAPRAGIEAVCRQLSDHNASRDRRDDGKYLDAFDLIFSYATGHGDDLPGLLSLALDYAIDQSAPLVIGKILDQPALSQAPDAAKKLDAALSFAGFLSFRGFNPVYYEDFEKIAVRLLDMGADPQIGLRTGVDARCLPIVDSALKHGADPRRNGREALATAKLAADGARPWDSAPKILESVLAAEKKLDEGDYAALQKASPGGLTVAGLRQVVDVQTGRTGLMMMAAAGRGDEALQIFRREDAEIRAADLLAADQSGYSALACLCDRGQAKQLLDKSFWRLRETEYTQVFDKMPAPVREELQEMHADLLTSLKAHRDAIQLRQQAEANRKRFRLK